MNASLPPVPTPSQRRLSLRLLLVPALVALVVLLAFPQRVHAAIITGPFPGPTVSTSGFGTPDARMRWNTVIGEVVSHQGEPQALSGGTFWFFNPNAANDRIQVRMLVLPWDAGAERPLPGAEPTLSEPVTIPVVPNAFSTLAFRFGAAPSLEPGRSYLVGLTTLFDANPEIHPTQPLSIGTNHGAPVNYASQVVQSPGDLDDPSLWSGMMAGQRRPGMQRILNFEPVTTPTPTPTPTITPTPTPSDTPTPEPSDTPTPEPSDTPTPEPSDTPTPEPSGSPSASPSPSPTATPSQDPSVAPVPTPTPTGTPSGTGPTPTPDPGELPQTGAPFTATLAAAGGAALVGLGATVLLIARRRS